jgi:formylmethanofuran dehydrogenase subunit E
MDRFALPFEPAEFAECDKCLSTIYVDDEREVNNGELWCMDCITAHDEEFLEEESA